MNHLNLQDMELAKLLLDPRRISILRHAKEQPVTIKQIAEQLGEKPSRLYYHVNKLVEHGLIKLVETKQHGNLIEHYYLTNPEHQGSYVLDRHMAAEHHEFIVQELLRLTQQGIQFIGENLRKEEAVESKLAEANIAYQSLTPREWAEKMHRISQALSNSTTEEPFVLENSQLGELADQVEKDEYVHVLLSYRLKDVNNP